MNGYRHLNDFEWIKRCFMWQWGSAWGWPCADPTNVISAALKWTIWVCMALAVGGVRVGTQKTRSNE